MRLIYTIYILYFCASIPARALPVSGFQTFFHLFSPVFSDYRQKTDCNCETQMIDYCKPLKKSE